MPFLSPDTTKEIRKAIKAAFPKDKFSIRTEHYSSLNIRILSASVTEEQLKEYHNTRDYDYRRLEHTPVTDYLDKIEAIVSSIKPQETISEDGDYGSIPNYYKNIGFSRWDIPYQQRVA